MTGAGAAARVHLDTAGAGRPSVGALARTTAHRAEEAANGACEAEPEPPILLRLGTPAA